LSPPCGGRRSRLERVAVAVSLAVTAASCGGAASGAGTTTLTVLAAASLNRVFPEIAAEFTRAHPDVKVRFSFAGTDALVVQVEQGSPGDIFAGASGKYGDRLFEEGLVEAPRTFATNRLVLVVPRSNPARIRSPRDLARPGIKLVVGAETVPIGSYTRKVLANLENLYGPSYSAMALANVVSNEDNVEGVLTKVRLGEADAGFVYVTDARAAGDTVLGLQLPAQAQAIAGYPIAVIRSRPHQALARQFQGFLLSGPAQRVLAEAGFGPPSAT
jgi:molybdate transport system substrate-binding protein